MDSTMDLAAMLPALKTDLNITADTYNERLLARMQTAVERITSMGITLGDTESDKDLVLMYAGWLWRERITGEGMGWMLQQALNYRLIGQSARRADA